MYELHINVLVATCGMFSDNNEHITAIASLVQKSVRSSLVLHFTLMTKFLNCEIYTNLQKVY